MNISEVFNTNRWHAASIEYMKDVLGKKRDDLKIYLWRNSKKELSPLSLYKYLKARFGLPIGAMMATKNFGTTDNLVHWHYHLLSCENEIHFVGKSGGIEVVLKLKEYIKFNSEDWEIMIKNIKSSFANQGKEMSSIQKTFERYTLFINPFTRLNKTLGDLKNELSSLNISEVQNNLNPDLTKAERDEYWKAFRDWISNMERAVSIGCTIRMLCPVLCESFINLVILVLCKEEIKKDRRRYENFLRQDIDVRIKDLNLKCNGFIKPIDSEDKRFKDFQTLMNSRNDFLHGNIDPKTLMFEDVYFDMGDIPLFNEDSGIIYKTMKNYLKNVEPETALGDHLKTMKFIAFILDHMVPSVADDLSQLMMTIMPALNRKTEGIAILFPNELAESYF